MTDVANEIKQFIGKNGKTATEIAESLKLDPPLVESALYKNMGTMFYQDSQYKWYIKSKKPMAKRVDVVDKDIYNTISYYLDCVVQDTEDEFTCFAKPSYGNVDYLKIDTLPTKDSYAEYFGSLASLDAKITNSKNKKEMLLGYPINIKKIVSKKDGKTYMVLEPVLISSVKKEENDYLLDSELPIINSSFLKSRTELDGFAIELAELETELGFTSLDSIGLSDAARRLQAIRNNWNWKQEINPNNMDIITDIPDISEEGIYNIGVLFVTERAPFTRGLKAELAQLAKMNKNAIKGTALEKFIAGSPINNSQNYGESDILEVLPLNHDQYIAVNKALRNDLTVVTGPPGTGKSQLITDIIANSVWHGGSVLFTSKNNRAVDVVDSRINNMSDKPVLLRTGSGGNSGNLAAYLLDVLNSPAPPDSAELEYKRLQSEYTALCQRQEDITEKINMLADIRNKADKLDLLITNLRKAKGTNYVSQLSKISDKELAATQSQYNQLLLLGRQIDPAEQTFFDKIIFKFNKNKIYAELSNLILKINSTIRFESSNPETLQPTLKNIKIISKDFGIFFEDIKKIKKHALELEKLYSFQPISDLFSENYRLHSKKTDLAQRIWRLYARMMPSRLSASNLRTIQQFKTILEMVVNCKDIYNELGSDIYIQYKQLAKHAVKYLPAWATTSLSARGNIAFEAAIFDIVVFDEASQCDIASALPLLFRAKRAVIIGDEKQLRHITNISEKKNLMMIRKYNLIESLEMSYTVNSLFSLANTMIDKTDAVTLRDHHRSHQDIIDFSNQYFYNQQLNVRTRYDKLNAPYDDYGVEWINCVGKVVRPVGGSALNEDEAKAIVKKLKTIVTDGYNGTIGITSPFRAQVNFIRKLISFDSELSIALRKNEFICDVVHKFQGDEKDLIIFSPVVAKGIHEGAIGFLVREGNIFNVAVTRAKAKLMIIGDYEYIKKDGRVTHLVGFIKWHDNYVEKKELLPIDKGSATITEWENDLFKALEKNGINALRQFMEKSVSIDLVIFDKKTKDRKLAIEVDGALHREWSGELRLKDQLRDEWLMSMGWEVMRLWNYQVRDNIDDCVNKIDAWLNVGHNN